MSSFKKMVFSLRWLAFCSLLILSHVSIFAEKILIICHQNFASTIQSYKTYKESIGFQVQLSIVPTDVLPTEVAITGHIRTANTTQAPVRYVQLVGDYEHIPGKYCFTDIGGYSDMLYGYLHGEIADFRLEDRGAATIAVGRFSVNSTTELQNIIDRTIAYEQNIKEDFWLHRAMGSFCGAAPPSTFITHATQTYNLLRNNWFSRVELRNTGSTIYHSLFPYPQDQYPNQPGNDPCFPINYISEGQSIYWRNGHDDFDQLGEFSIADAVNWMNYSKLCIAFSWGCLAGNHKNQECISERLLYQKNNGQNVGAVAVMSNSMATTIAADPIQEMLNYFLFDPDYSTIGMLLLRTADSVYSNHQYVAARSYLATLHLFGDVTLKLAFKYNPPLFTDMVLPNFVHKAYLSYGMVDSYTYKATNSISTTEEACFAIGSGCDINMLAGNSIVLKPGFNAIEGAHFSAVIGTPIVGKMAQGQDTYQNIAHRAICDTVLRLEQNSPNPFNPQTKISFTLPFVDNKPVDAHCRLTVYSVSGKMVKNITDEQKISGKYSSYWNATNTEGKKVSAGVYIYRIQWANFSAYRTMTLIY